MYSVHHVHSLSARSTEDAAVTNSVKHDMDKGIYNDGNIHHVYDLIKLISRLTSSCMCRLQIQSCYKVNRYNQDDFLLEAELCWPVLL